MSIQYSLVPREMIRDLFRPPTQNLDEFLIESSERGMQKALKKPKKKAEMSKHRADYYSKLRNLIRTKKSVENRPIQVEVSNIASAIRGPSEKLVEEPKTAEKKAKNMVQVKPKKLVQVSEEEEDEDPLIFHTPQQKLEPPQKPEPQQEASPKRTRRTKTQKDVLVNQATKEIAKHISKSYGIGSMSNKDIMDTARVIVAHNIRETTGVPSPPNSRKLRTLAKDDTVVTNILSDLTKQIGAGARKIVLERWQPPSRKLKKLIRIQNRRRVFPVSRMS